MKELNFNTTAQIKVPKRLIDQIIGQNEGIEIIKKASSQRRNVLLIGEPGTGKSLLGQALAELLPREKLLDIISLDNPTDENVPIIKTLPKGQGIELITKAKLSSLSAFKTQNFFLFIFLLLAIIAPFWIRKQYGDIMAAASLISSILLLAIFILFLNLNRRMRIEEKIPKLIIDNSKKDKAPFLDATGGHAGALLGDVLHDPLQSFSSNNQILKSNEKKTRISTEVNKILKKHEKELIKEKGYIAAYLKKDELYILAEKDGKIQPVEVLSVNKYLSDKPYLYKITTESGKTLLVTPEHKIAVNNKGKKQYIEALKLKNGKEVFVE